jgi:RNA polymerase sigma-70 factor (ECF subfamily)
VDTSPSVLERAKASDEQAWQRLRDLYAPLVYEWCRRAGLHAEDAADVGQEVFLAVARNLARFRHDRPQDTFRGWLRTITGSKIANLRRTVNMGPAGKGGSDAHRQLLRVPEQTDDSSTELLLDDEARLLHTRAVEIITQDFPKWYGSAFMAVVVEQRPPAEVAAELGVRRSAVYNAKARILRRLREEFADVL